MKHAGPGVLARISPLLEQLRARPVLRETRPGVFELKSRAFLHFHDDPSGIYADVRLAEGFVRLPVTSSSQQSDLLERIADCVSAIELCLIGVATGRAQGERTCLSEAVPVDACFGAEFNWTEGLLLFPQERNRVAVRPLSRAEGLRACAHIVLEHVTVLVRATDRSYELSAAGPRSVARRRTVIRGKFLFRVKV